MGTTRIVQAVLGLVIAAFSATSTAKASTIYNTTDPGTGFDGITLTLLSTSGAAAELTFIPTADTSTGVPSNINYGVFSLFCGLCSTQDLGTGAFFAAFTFDLIITDVSDGATGKITGTSTGGTVFSDTSPITIFWSPLQVGAGTNNAQTGNFGSTAFQIINSTKIVAPNSGTLPGLTTVQGNIGSGSDFPIDGEVPEPMTFGLVGATLLGLGIWRHRRS